MPINAIRTGDIFHRDHLNPGENGILGPQIVFGINTAGTNLDGHSVAYQVGQRYSREFQRIIQEGGLKIGDVYSAQGELDIALPARFHGIVCNEKGISGKHDWSFGDLGVTEGLAKLSEGRIIRPRQVEMRIQSVQHDVSKMMEEGFDFQKLADIVESAKLEMNPPLRMAFIGTGPSGTQNQADWRSILQAMNDTDLNIVLYLWNKAVADQVANVVRLFPALRESRPLREIEEIRLAA